MKKLFKYLRGYEKECVLAPLFKMLEAIFELLVPLVVAQIVDVGIGNKDMGFVVRMGLVMVALGVVGLICSATAQFFAAKAAVGFAARLRHQLLEHVLRFSHTQIDNIGTSTMVTRMTADVNLVQNGVNLGLRLLLRSPFVVFGAMIMAFTIDFESALIFAGVIGVLCVVVFGIKLFTMPMYKRSQGSLDAVTSAIRQNLAGVRVLRAFRKEKAEEKAFREQTEDLTGRQLSAGAISSMLNPMTFVIVNIAVILLIHTGAIQVHEGILTQGLVIALYNYMTQILVELIKMANLTIIITKAVVSGNRVQSILDIELQDDHGPCAEQIKGQVEMRDVTALYEGAGHPSLEHVSFTADAGQTIGIIGGTGSGKTTFINLIAGFYNAHAGSVIIDGRNIRDYAPDILRSGIGIVPQKAVLFKGTIRENLCWGKKDATDEQLWKALEIAQAREVVESKEGMLDAEVLQGGTNFSGGQRQRLTIARALVGEPAILILDDSASALDYATDARLRMAIRSMDQAPTTFIVSQRAASVLYADKIIVLEDGEVAGIGKHEELLESCDVYREIYYSQFSKEVAQHE